MKPTEKYMLLAFGILVMLAWLAAVIFVVRFFRLPLERRDKTLARLLRFHHLAGRLQKSPATMLEAGDSLQRFQQVKSLQKWMMFAIALDLASTIFTLVIGWYFGGFSNFIGLFSFTFVAPFFALQTAYSLLLYYLLGEHTRRRQRQDLLGY